MTSAPGPMEAAFELMSAIASFGPSTTGESPAAASASPPGRHAPFTLGLTLADEHRKGVCERSEIGCADRAERRHHGRDTGVQQIGDRLRDRRRDARRASARDRQASR